MVKLVCPGCGGKYRMVSTSIVLRTTGNLELYSTSDGLMHRSEQAFAIGDLPAADTIEEYRCPRCGGHYPSGDWAIEFYCSDCGELIVCPNDPGDPNTFAMVHTCRNSHGAKCYRCWATVDRNYCPDCRERSRCQAYQHYTALETAGTVSPPRPRRRSASMYAARIDPGRNLWTDNMPQEATPDEP